jgi:NADPH:quinone reductase-like Zn-dependent oxidoreductase
MKAIVYTKFGSPDVLHLKELEKPTPKENEMLIKVHSASVNYGDLAARNFKNISPKEFNMLFLIWLIAKISFGLNRPNNPILGSEFSGTVESTGKNVTHFKPGDPVFGYLGQAMGAYAEYICVPENGVLAIKPVNMSYEESATIPYGSIMAIHLLRKANVRAGQKVLINGASGGIGSAAVQIAKHMGAEVTGVCAAPRLEYVKSLGADKVIDYKNEDFTKNGETYDLILDILGKSPFSLCKKSLKPKGILLHASFKMRHILDMLRTSKSDGKRVICAMAPGSQDDLLSVKELIETEKIKSVLDKIFPMEQAAEAHRYVEEGHKQGNVAIMLNHISANVQEN